MKMNKRMLKVAVVSALTVAFAVPAFANPFTDVPVKHWSYDSVNKLAQAGIIDGYGPRRQTNARANSQSTSQF